MKAYVINLERSPERKIYMQKLLKKFPFLDVEFVTAVDGRAMNENERIHQFDVDKFYARYSVMPRPGEIGCTLSHQKCYCKMVKEGIPCALILEDDIVLGENNYTKLVSEYAEKERAGVIVMCCKMESELSELNDDDKKVFLQELGINSSGLDRLIFATYSLLGLETFFTAGSDECRAWTFKRGMNAKACAGLIHSDIERGFIKAEVMSFDDLYQYKSELKVKEAGKLRLEGKDYLMQDGDIVYFRFNV